MSRSEPKKRGFTLIEALFSFLIFSIVLSALAYSLSQLSRASLARKDFGLELEVLQLNSILRADAMSATQVSAAENSLTLQGQNPKLSATTRLEQGLDTDMSRREVVFQFKEGWLFRTETAAGISDSTSLAHLQSFQAEKSNNLLTVKYEIKKLNRSQLMTVKVGLL